MAKLTYLQERRRCLDLVQEYRKKLQARMLVHHNTPSNMVVTSQGVMLLASDAVLIMEGVINQLFLIEREIESPRVGSKSGGDFSLDEMSIAEQLIAEQDQNPFEE